MIRLALGILAAGSVVAAIAGSCSAPAPKPLDVGSYPSAKTSAEPLFVTNARPDASAVPSAPAPSAPAPSAPAPSAAPVVSAPVLAPDPWK